MNSRASEIHRCASVRFFLFLLIEYSSWSWWNNNKKNYDSQENNSLSKTVITIFPFDYTQTNWLIHCKRREYIIHKKKSLAAKIFLWDQVESSRLRQWKNSPIQFVLKWFHEQIYLRKPMENASHQTIIHKFVIYSVFEYNLSLFNSYTQRRPTEHLT